jgi:hypothetical protein
VEPVGTAEQSSVDSQLARSEQAPSVSATDLESLPAAGDSLGYPAIPAPDRTDAGSYATAFVRELIGRNYAGQSRRALLAWAQAESAPNTLPGVVSKLASRSLVLSLADPAAASGLVPGSAAWMEAAAAGESQTVSNVATTTDPSWLALTASGWQPTDPAMTMLTVSGTLVTSGPTGSQEGSFSLTLTLGSNGLRPGLGAVAVDDWTVL